MQESRVRELVTGRSLTFLIAVALVCGALAGVFTSRYVRADQQATGTLSVVQVSGRVSAYDLAVWTADFQTAFGDDTTAKAAQKAAGDSTPGLLNSTVSSNSSIVTVTYTASTATGARNGLVAAVQSDLLVLATQTKQRAAVEAGAALAHQTEAVEDLAGWRARTGQVDVTGATTAYQAALARKSPNAAHLAAVLSGFELRQANLDAANTTLATAADQLSLANAVLTSLARQPVVTIESVDPLSTKSAVIQAVVAAMAGGVLAAAGLVLLIGRRRSRRSPRATPLPLTQLEDAVTRGYLQAAEAAAEAVLPDRVSRRRSDQTETARSDEATATPIKRTVSARGPAKAPSAADRLWEDIGASSRQPTRPHLEPVPPLTQSARSAAVRSDPPRPGPATTDPEPASPVRLVSDRTPPAAEGPSQPSGPGSNDQRVPGSTTTESDATPTGTEQDEDVPDAREPLSLAELRASIGSRRW